MVRYAWLIPSFPAVSFFLIAFFGKRMPRRGSEIGIAAVLLSFVLSIFVWGHFIGGGGSVTSSVTYFQLDGFRLDVGQNVDGLAAVMFAVVTLVSLLVQVYSTAYMHGDSRYTWYYAALSLFTAAMLNLVIADNLFQLLVGWELVGICSYLLIGHWWEEKENSDAAVKAFITTKSGDVPFLFGIFALTIAAGTAGIPEITQKVAAGGIGTGILTVSALLLFGAQYRVYNTADFISLSSGIQIGSVTIDSVQILVLVLGVVLMAGLQLLVNRTRLGRQMRAVAADREAAEMLGINVNFVITATFFLGSALAGVAGIMGGLLFNQVTSTIGFIAGLKAFTAAVVGGIGSIPGAMLGGLVIGVAESFVTGYISSTYSNLIVFGILIVVMLVRPSGLLGRAQLQKV